MSDDDDSPNTIFLKETRIGQQEEESSTPTNLVRLVCLDTSLLDSVPADNVFLLTNNEEILGRGDECTVRIDSSEVSRKHARITAYSDRWVIEDTDSLNGISVNDGELQGRTVIADGDLLCLGKIPFRFEEVDAADENDSIAVPGDDGSEGMAVEDDEMIAFPEPPAPAAPAQAAEESEELSLPEPEELSVPEPEELSLPVPEEL